MVSHTLLLFLICGCGNHGGLLLLLLSFLGLVLGTSGGGSVGLYRAVNLGREGTSDGELGALGLVEGGEVGEELSGELEGLCELRKVLGLWRES